MSHEFIVFSDSQAARKKSPLHQIRYPAAYHDILDCSVRELDKFTSILAIHADHETVGLERIGKLGLVFVVDSPYVVFGGSDTRTTRSEVTSQLAHDTARFGATDDGLCDSSSRCLRLGVKRWIKEQLSDFSC